MIIFDEMSSFPSSPPVDISSALRSVALMGAFDFGKLHSAVPKLFSVPSQDDSTCSPLVDQETSTGG